MSNFRNHLRRKVIHPISFVYYESNMIDVNHNTWWIIHILNTLQGMQNLMKPVETVQCIYLGNKMRSHVKVIGTYTFVLSGGFVLSLEKTFYILSFSRNLISVSRLVPFGYSLNFS